MYGKKPPISHPFFVYILMVTIVDKCWSREYNVGYNAIVGVE